MKSIYFALLFLCLTTTFLLPQSNPEPPKMRLVSPISAPQALPLVGVTSSTKNPLQIAILYWYNANLTTTFGVGTEPFAVAFDGFSMWVTNGVSDTVS